MAEDDRRRWPAVGGLVVLVATVIAAVGLWMLGERRYDENVAAFARAPMGCETTLEFDGGGEFLLYIETTGRIDADLDGGCNMERRYQRPASGLPRPELTLRDPAGESLPLGPTGGVDYEARGYVGTVYRLVDIDAAGEYLLTVPATEGESFAVAVGPNPDDGVVFWRGAALATLAGGLVIAGLLVGIARRRPQPASPVAAPWVPTSEVSWPVSPPGFPVPPPTTGAAGPPVQAPRDEGPPRWGPPV